MFFWHSSSLLSVATITTRVTHSYSSPNPNEGDKDWPRWETKGRGMKERVWPSEQGSGWTHSSPVHSLGFVINAFGTGLVPLTTTEHANLPFRHKPPLCELISFPFSLPPNLVPYPRCKWSGKMFDSLQHMTLPPPLTTHWQTSANFPSSHIQLGKEGR